MKPFNAILMLLLSLVLTGCLSFSLYGKSMSGEPTIYNCPDGRMKMQCLADFKALGKIARKFPHSKIGNKPEIYFIPTMWDEGSSIEVKEKCKTSQITIYTAKSRGKWLHELCHYYNYFIKDDYKDEFILTTMDWIVTGLDIDTYTSYWRIK